MSGVGAFDRSGEILDCNNRCIGVLLLQYVIAKQSGYVQPLELRPLEARVVEVVAVNVDASLCQIDSPK